MIKTSNAAVRGLTALFLAAASAGASLAAPAAPAQPERPRVADLTADTYQPLNIAGREGFRIFDRTIGILKDRYINPNLRDSKLVADAIGGMAGYIAGQETKAEMDALDAQARAQIHAGAREIPPALKAAIEAANKKFEDAKKSIIDAAQSPDAHSDRLIDELTRAVIDDDQAQIRHMPEMIAQAKRQLNTEYQARIAGLNADSHTSRAEKRALAGTLRRDLANKLDRVDGIAQSMLQDLQWESESDNGKASVHDGLALEYSAMKMLETHPGLRGKEKTLIEAGLDGMLSGLDPHSSFFNEEQTQQNREQSRAAFGGIGLEIVEKNGAIVAGKTIGDDSPATLAHIQKGDVITKIENEPTTNMSASDVADKIRGPLGTQVHVELKRPGVDQPIELTLTRSTIHTPSVTQEVLISENGRKIGYIKMRDFMDQNIPQELEKAFRELGDVDGYILNLRGNPGGLVSNAVETSDDFLNSGDIVREITREGRGFAFRATPGDLAQGKPVTVLIDTGSASASEIVTRALKGNNRVTVLGSRSYGKGSVQDVLTFGDMIPNTYLHFTTGLYLTPNNISIQGLGITPDIEARIPGDTFERHESDNASMIANPNAPDVVVQSTPSESCTLKPAFNAAATLAEPYVIHMNDDKTVVDVPLVCAVASMTGRHSSVVEFKPWVAPPPAGP
jgi:carboxyl-terminal processing protease